METPAGSPQAQGNANGATGKGVGAGRWLRRTPGPQPAVPRSPARRLADLADREGLTESYAASQPTLLGSVNLTPDQMTSEVVRAAQRINRLANRRLLARYSGLAGVPEMDLHREEIFGFDIRTVAVWMGSDAWTFEEAWRVLDYFHCDLADETIQLYLRDGREGVGRSPAPLSSGQQETLRELSEKFLKSKRSRRFQLPIIN